MADYIFSLFEFMYEDQEHTWRLLDSERARSDDDTLDYLVTLLQNPRLLYYWDEGKLSYEYPTYYQLLRPSRS